MSRAIPGHTGPSIHDHMYQTIQTPEMASVVGAHSHHPLRSQEHGLQNSFCKTGPILKTGWFSVKIKAKYCSKCFFCSISSVYRPVLSVLKSETILILQSFVRRRADEYGLSMHMPGAPGSQKQHGPLGTLEAWSLSVPVESMPSVIR
jgi:hypothetical protein